MDLRKDKKIELITSHLTLLIIFPLHYLSSPEGFLNGGWMISAAFYIVSSSMGLSLWYYIYMTPYKQEKEGRDLDDHNRLIYSGVSNKKDKMGKLDGFVLIIFLIGFYLIAIFNLWAFHVPRLLLMASIIAGGLIVLSVSYNHYSLVLKHLLFRTPTRIYNDRLVFSMDNRTVKVPKHEISRIYRVRWVVRWKAPSFLKYFYDKEKYGLEVEKLDGETLNSNFIRSNRLDRILLDIEEFWGGGYTAEDEEREIAIFAFSFLRDGKIK